MISNSIVQIVLWTSLTIVLYALFLTLYKKTRIVLLNPIILSAAVIIALLIRFDYTAQEYRSLVAPLYLLLPFTVILLAYPLFQKLHLLKHEKRAIFMGIGAGVITSMVSVVLLGKLLGLDSELILSIFPKSITTPLGMTLSTSLNAIMSLTVIAIVITGVTGVLVYPLVFKIFRITHPVAKGIALGTASHAVGTGKALELGETEGAMAGLAIVLSGIITILCTPLFLWISTLL